MWSDSCLSTRAICCCYWDTTRETSSFCRFCKRSVLCGFHRCMWCRQPCSDIHVNGDGAVPVGVMITDSTSAASYVSAFTLLKSILPDQSFGCREHPAIFLTDDCDAERTALQTCWPDADQKLCLFHVPQAVWRWLWSEQHRIAKDDRRILMSAPRTRRLRRFVPPKINPGYAPVTENRQTT